MSCSSAARATASSSATSVRVSESSGVRAPLDRVERVKSRPKQLKHGWRFLHDAERIGRGKRGASVRIGRISLEQPTVKRAGGVVCFPPLTSRYTRNGGRALRANRPRV